MYNLLIALGAGAAAFLAFWLPGIVPAWGAVLPALVAASVIYLLLARRIMRRIEALMKEAEKELYALRSDPKAVTHKDVKARYIERAIQILEKGLRFDNWQFLAAAQVHSQVGVLLYVQDELDRALPHLEKSFSRHWVARAMLGAALARKKDAARMEQVFEAAVKASKKEPLLWALYAWCLAEAGQREKAIRVSGRGVALNENDEKLKALHLALQNQEKDKTLVKRMRAWGDEWYQFRFEKHPMEKMISAGGRRVMFQRR